MVPSSSLDEIKKLSKKSLVNNVDCASMTDVKVSELSYDKSEVCKLNGDGCAYKTPEHGNENGTADFPQNDKLSVEHLLHHPPNLVDGMKLDHSKTADHQNGSIPLIFTKNGIVTSTHKEKQADIDEKVMLMDKVPQGKQVSDAACHSGKSDEGGVIVVDAGVTRMLTLDCSCRKSSTRVAHLAILILVLSNMVNYMDRYTIAGLLDDVKEHYQIDDSGAGLLQSVFIIFYMVSSPLFGYLGDRYNRKYIMIASIIFWSSINLASSFIPESYFIVFLLMRGLVGVGEAGFAMVTPTIIADLYTKETRSLALAVFFLAIPIGSGMGYIVGSYMANAFHGWQWSLRATPILGIICAILTVFLINEPSRGAAEGGRSVSVTSVRDDIRYLVRNKSFMLSTAAFTCVCFVVGALSWWAPNFLTKSILVQGNIAHDAEKDLAERVSFIFGVITCLAGFSGLGLGAVFATVLRRHTPRADPLICAFGLIAGAPFLYFVIVFSRYSTTSTWVCIYLCETLLSLNWALVIDILLYVVVPTRRAMATAVQNFICHLLGDAGSPYLTGLIAQVAAGGSVEIPVEYVTKQYGLYMTCFVSVIGGGFFLGTAIYVHRDRTETNKAILDAQMVVTDNTTVISSNGLSDNKHENDCEAANGNIPDRVARL